jgi:hypothetical protein
MQSAAPTVQAYLDALPADRRATIDALRATIQASIDPAYEETMQYGMISWVIPHSLHPAGYHCNPKEPLPFAALASQKNYMSLYLMGMYIGCTPEAETEEVEWFRTAWAASGKKKLDMGKSCVRFKKLDDIALDVIGESFRRMPAQRYLAAYLKTLEK